MATGINVTLIGTVTSRLQDDSNPSAPAGATSLRSVPEDQFGDSARNTFGFGSGAGLAQSHFHGRWSVGAAAQITFDMRGGIEDVFGNTITADRLRGIFVRNLSDDSGDVLELFGDSAPSGDTANILDPGGTDALVLGPGGFVLISNPVVGYVVDDTSRNLEVHNPGASEIEFEIYLLFE